MVGAGVGRSDGAGSVVDLGALQKAELTGL